MNVQTSPVSDTMLRCGPRVSVITAAYNAAPYLAQCIQSILGQTFVDFELIVIDDASTDGTPDILANYRDPRLRVVRNDRNLGVVGARNRGMKMARGELIAPFDADDVSLPTRLAKQVAFLDANPDVNLVGTATFYLEDGESRPGRSVHDNSPMMLRWLLHVGNPFGHSTLMYRASTVAAMGQFLREDYRYAEDFEFCHRVMQVGQLGFLSEPLLLYRRHQAGVSVQHEAEMVAQSRRVLTDAYRPWLGSGAADAAAIVISYLFGGKPAPNNEVLIQVGAVLTRLVDGFLAHNTVTPAHRDAILDHAGALWWGVVRSSVRSGQVSALLVQPPAIAKSRHGDFNTAEAVLSAISGLIPFKQALVPAMRGAWKGLAPAPAPAGVTRLSGIEYRSAAVEPNRPATLYVVVDTEAEFDWNGPFERAHMAVTAMSAIGRGQAVFDRYGLRPVYVTDYAVASQTDGFLPLRAIFDRGACEIGAHLHPWITPPFEEALSVSNSYAGNLPIELERRKLATLLQVFRKNFGFDPKFFKAGRYGIGPNTMQLLIENGIKVDFSIIPGRDLSTKGGPDFRDFTSAAQTVGEGRVLSVPMTRGPIGLLSSHHAGVPRYLERGLARRMMVPAALSRLGVLETVTLTPEGEPASKQVALMRAMLARKERQFVLHYHSPSLAPGFTPYARTPDDVDRIVRRLETVCRTFFEVLGGVPGNPQDLLPPDQRTPWPNVSRTVAGWERGASAC